MHYRSAGEEPSGGELLHTHARHIHALMHSHTLTHTYLYTTGIIDQQVKNLSGGELQRVAIVLCLGKPADIYLIDERTYAPVLCFVCVVCFL
jgi:translation initiation factor RLI1